MRYYVLIVDRRGLETWYCHGGRREQIGQLMESARASEQGVYDGDGALLALFEDAIMEEVIYTWREGDDS